MHRLGGLRCFMMPTINRTIGVKAECLDTWRSVRELCEQGSVAEAVDSAEFIAHQGQQPLPVHILYCLLKQCIKGKDLKTGRRLHKLIERAGLSTHPFLANHLIRLYAATGDVEDARRIFDKLPHRDHHVWTSMISSYVRQGQGEQALELYHEMLQSDANPKPNAQTYAAVLNACASIRDLRSGTLVHSHIINCKLESDVLVGNSLIDMYSKCGSLDEACVVFCALPERNVVTWTSMIGGCVQHGQVSGAFELFEKMQKQGMEPDRVTFLCMLRACSSKKGGLELGRAVHAQILKSGIRLDLQLGSSLVNMYAQCGSIREARRVFLGLVDRDVVSWNTMVLGCAKLGHYWEALHLYENMLKEQVKPSTVTYVAVLKACGGIAALEKGEAIHFQLAKSGFDSHLFVGNALIDMYAKCGRVDKAMQVFLKLMNRDIVSWNAIIDACAQQGHADHAIHLFERMCIQGLKPDVVTLTCVLSACSHAGLVNKARSLFSSMQKEFDMWPALEHYTCMVDLLCRSGNLLEAHELISKMPIPPHVAPWMSLLGACKVHGNLEIGKHAFGTIIRLEPFNVSAYALMSTIFAMAGQRDDAATIRKEMARHLG